MAERKSERSLAGDAANQEQHDCYDDHRDDAPTNVPALKIPPMAAQPAALTLSLTPSKGGQPARRGIPSGITRLDVRPEP